jgi:hypothetical protein
MEAEELRELNDKIASLHKEGDVFSYHVERNRRIMFPRGFLRSFNTYKGFLGFIEDSNLTNKIVMHMLHRDTLHWVWLKTDIVAHARMMIVKFQLINLASILEAIVKYLKPDMPKTKTSVYDRIDILAMEGRISNPTELKSLWGSRKSIHLHLTGEVEQVEFSDDNYRTWHSAMRILIEDLNK